MRKITAEEFHKAFAPVISLLVQADPETQRRLILYTVAIYTWQLTALFKWPPAQSDQVQALSDAYAAALSLMDKDLLDAVGHTQQMTRQIVTQQRDAEKMA